jgi:hypothetical protein
MFRPAPALLLVLVTGCSFQAQCGTPRVDKAKTEALVTALAAAVDTVESATCPATVEAEVGASFECTVTFADDSRHVAVVKVTGVEGSDVRADATWKTPLFGGKKRAEIEHSISQTVGAAGTLTCPPGVQAVAVDQRIRCTIRGAEGPAAPVDIWYTADATFNWKLNPDEPPAEAPPAEAPAP